MIEYFKLLRYLLPYKGKVALSLIFNLFFIFFGLFSVTMIIPFLGILFHTKPLITELPSFKLSIDYVINYTYYILSKIIIAKGESTALLLLCLFIVLMTFFKTGSRYMSLYFLAPVRNGIVKDIRNKLFNKILKLPLSYYSDERRGDIMARITSDVQEIESSIMTSLETFFTDPILIIVYVIVLLSMSVNLTLFVLVLLPVSGYLIGLLGKTLRSKSYKGQRRFGVMLSILEETISGLRIIKAFNAEEKIARKYSLVNNFYTKLLTKVFRRRSLASPLSEFLGTFVMASILFYGSNLVLANKGLEPEMLIGYLVIFYMIINPAKSFSTAYYNVLKGLASSDRINTILNAVETIKDSPEAIQIESFNNYIEYKNVYFKYEKNPVLKNINLKIEKGKTIAIVGNSGSGKSTLVDMLPRLIEANEGEIIIDNINIKNININSLRNLMGIVTQESVLFNDTVYNNIAFGHTNSNIDDVINAAKAANAHDFIMAMKNNYFTNIGDKGNKLSGGQKQRICIARAIYKNPPILILDEATSSLDTESEKLVQDALNKLMKNRTSIVIAHRLSTVKNADEIIVINEGEIVERGKHNELLSFNGVYKKLYDLQMFS
jgi:subfamily B ATP-binding cassette protein MsbA